MAEAVGDYLLEDRLPATGGSDVWRARSPSGDLVRLCVSDPGRVPADRAVRAFERLTAALTRWGRQPWPGLEAPVGTVLPDETGRFALATAWVPGQPVDEALPAAGFERVERAVAVGIEVGRTLAALHAADAVHGAVARRNVWASPDGAILLSFWWSQANLRDHPGPSAPEAISSGRFDARADQWAWGRLLRELLTPDLDLPGDLESILTRSTEREPSDRYASMAEAVAALEAFERTLRTDDVDGGRGSEAQTVDLGAHAPEPPTEDLGRQGPSLGDRSAEAATEDVGEADPTAREAPPEPTDAPEKTMQLPRPKRSPPPWLLWTAAVGLTALALALLGGVVGGGPRTAEPAGQSP